MNYLDRFNLPLAELPVGDHTFEYLVDDNFFDHFESSEIKRGKVSLELLLQKFEDMIILDYDFVGVANMLCDRCNDKLDIRIKGKQKLIIKFGSAIKYEESDDVLLMPVLHNEFNISQYVYEYLNLALPVSRRHQKGKCNKQIVDKLKELSHGSDQHPPDPRWEALRKLKIKEN